MVFPSNRISRTRFILSGGGLWQPGFCPFLFAWNFIWKFLKLGVSESFHLDLNTWASLAFTQVFTSLPNHHFTSDPPQNNLWDIFLKWKIFIFFSKTLASSMSSKATLIFLAHKNLRNFPNILWTLGLLPKQKYFITFWNIFATENIFCSGQKWWFLQQLPFYLLHCAWVFLCIFTLVTLG